MEATQTAVKGQTVTGETWDGKTVTGTVVKVYPFATAIVVESGEVVIIDGPIVTSAR